MTIETKPTGSKFVKYTVGFFVAIICLGFMAAIAGGKKDTGSSGSSSAPEVPAKASYSVGDVIKFKDSEWAVLVAKDWGNELSAGEGLPTKKTEGKFIAVKFSVKNATNEEETILETPKLVDSKGRKFNQIDDGDLYLKDEKSMTLEQLPSGIKKKFVGIYEVPVDADGLTFEARSLEFSPSYKKVNLGL